MESKLKRQGVFVSGRLKEKVRQRALQLQRVNQRLREELTHNSRVQRQLAASLEEIRLKNRQLEDMLRAQQALAELDHLTGLANRRTLAGRLQTAYAEAIRYGFDLSCIMADLDNYKALNDRLGHQAGDRLLVAAAEIIRENLRGSDFAARYGGDEFVILLPHTSAGLARHVAGRIRRQLADRTAHLAPGGATCSMGLAAIKSDHPASAEDLVNLADRALYAAKRQGRNRLLAFPDNAPQAIPA